MAANRGQAFMFMAVLLGGAAAVAAYFSITAMASQAVKQNTKDFRPVVVTASDLTYGVKLEPAMLRVVKYPKDAVPLGAFSSIDSVAGQTTKVFMSQREPVTAIKLSSRGGGLSMLVRPTMRAISLEVDQVSGVSGFVLPGDKVDVLVTVDPRRSDAEAITKTILQNIEVLAAGQKTSQQDNKPITVQAVTLLCDPEATEKLAHAQKEGEITLALRNPEDQEEVKVASYSTREMISGARMASAPTPARRGPARAAVQQTRTAPAPAPARFTRREEPKIRIIRSAKVDEQDAPTDSSVTSR